MNTDPIHIHKDTGFGKGKMFFLMIPCLVFLVVLLLYLAAVAYS